MNDQNDQLMTPLLILASDCTKEAISVAKIIMHYRGDLDITNDLGYSALALCIIHNNIELAKILVQHKARMFNLD
jgi:ankyrin repeat protein